MGGRGRGNEGQAGWKALLPGGWGEVVQFGLFADGNTAYAVVHPYPHPKWLLQQKKTERTPDKDFKEMVIPFHHMDFKKRLQTNINM